MTTSAHVDTFTIDSLPPVEQLPDVLFDLPELQYPQVLNCAEALLGDTDADRPCLISDGETWSYGQTRET
ncbi:MAG: 2-aminobenzoate-CoA ligase, partial [Actinobacteria bacterium]|nr:2-aminobenzoate-CoA ligase [Actinomycetota bacterium]